MKTAEKILKKYYKPNAYDVKECAEMGRGILYFEEHILQAMEEYASQFRQPEAVKSVCEICEAYSGEKKSKTNYCRCCGRRII